MELAVDAAQSRQLPEFLQRFAGRAARMLNAAWGGVAVFRGRETDLYAGAQNEKASSAALKSWIISSAQNRVDYCLRRFSTEETRTQGMTKTRPSAVFVPITQATASVWV